MNVEMPEWLARQFLGYIEEAIQIEVHRPKTQDDIPRSERYIQQLERVADNIQDELDEQERLFNQVMVESHKKNTEAAHAQRMRIKAGKDGTLAGAIHRATSNPDEEEP